MSSDDGVSRRSVLGGMMVGMAAASAASGVGVARAADTSGASASSTAPVLEDPRTKYPRPPFPAQRLEWPGLASQMRPRPDHGETSYVGSGKLNGRRALITGGDSGIGRATAIAFAREGADVAIGYLPFEEPDAKETLDLIRAEGRKAVALPGDVRDEAFCKKIVADAVQGLGGLDILVNNAARQTAQKSIEDISTEQFDSTMKTNLYALFWITKAALPHLKPGSTIINTTSVVAENPPPTLFDYAGTKAAIANFTRSLSQQLAERGIRVNAVAPGPFWTPLQPSGGQLPDKLPQFGADSPMGRPGQPAEIAYLYVLLAQPGASFVTGDVIASTGGSGAR